MVARAAAWRGMGSANDEYGDGMSRGRGGRDMRRVHAYRGVNDVASGGAWRHAPESAPRCGAWVGENAVGLGDAQYTRVR